MRKQITAAMLMLLVTPAFAWAARSTFNYGDLKSSAGKIEMSFAGARISKIAWIGAARVELIKEGVVLTADNVTVYPAQTPPAKPGAKPTAAQDFRPERIVLKGAKSQIVAEQKGFLLTGKEITIVLPKETGAGEFIETASAKGGVTFSQSKTDLKANGKADSLDLSEKGNRVVLTGGAAVDWTTVTYTTTPAGQKTPQQYTGNLAGDKITMTGLLAPPGQEANPLIFVESREPTSELIISPTTGNSR